MTSEQYNQNSNILSDFPHVYAYLLTSHLTSNVSGNYQLFKNMQNLINSKKISKNISGMQKGQP
jgi:hypothetical protein